MGAFCLIRYYHLMSDNSRGFANLENFYSKPVSSFLHNHVVQVWHVGVQEELDELKIKKREVKRQVC